MAGRHAFRPPVADLLHGAFDSLVLQCAFALRNVDWQGDLGDDFAGFQYATSGHLIMAQLNIIAFDGTRFDLSVEEGSTVMENAVRNSVPGIDAECGGACACATCHVYVDDEWVEKAGSPSPMEEDMLDFAVDVRPNSRLSCQIKMTAALDGLTVHVPERQG